MTTYAPGDRQSAGLRQRMRAPLIIAMSTVLALIGGGLSATGKPMLIAAFFGMILTLLILSSRTALFWYVMVGGTIVTGVCQLYVPDLKYVRLIVPLATAPLLLHGVMDYFTSWANESEAPLPSILGWALAFALACLVSALVNLSEPAVALVGLKDYLGMWGLFLSVVFLRWPATFTRNLAWGMFLIALVQLPFVLHEYLVLVPKRFGMGGGIVPVDIVAGTFGASLTAGGDNAVLAAYQVIVVACLLALWKNGLLSGIKTAILSILLLSPMVVNEAKIAALYVPLAYIVVFHRDIARQPLKFLAAGASTAALLGILLAALVWGINSDNVRTTSDLIDRVVSEESASSDQLQGHYFELTRWTSLTFWAQEHVKANPINTLIGHGVGASRENYASLVAATTLAEKRYPGLHIGYTALSSLLWDTGIIGLVTVLGMLGSAFLTAGRLAHHYQDRDKVRTSLFEGLQAGIAVLALSLAHKDFLVNSIPYQTFTYVIIGFIAYSWIEVGRAGGQRNSA